jgi:hypothetical protein
MVLTGILRHYATVLMASSPKKLDKKALREQRALAHGISVRTNHHVLSRSSFTARRDALMTAFESGAYLKDPDARGQPPPNPMSDPNAMEGMMGMMKNQMAMIIPNTMIMGWINTFFSGYVISEFFLLHGRELGELGCADAEVSYYYYYYSETPLPPDHQVQEHAAGRRRDQGHGPQVDVEYQLVLFVLFWAAARVQFPARQR